MEIRNTTDITTLDTVDNMWASNSVTFLNYSTDAQEGINALTTFLAGIGVNNPRVELYQRGCLKLLVEENLNEAAILVVTVEDSNASGSPKRIVTEIEINKYNLVDIDIINFSRENTDVKVGIVNNKEYRILDSYIIRLPKKSTYTYSIGIGKKSNHRAFG